MQWIDAKVNTLGTGENSGIVMRIFHKCYYKKATIEMPEGT